MTLKDLRNQLNELPNCIEDDSSARVYLDTLKDKFIEKVMVFSTTTTEGKKEYNHFEGIEDKTDAGIEGFLKKLTEKIEMFNKRCLCCLQPISKPKDFEEFVNIFFKNRECKDGKIMTETIRNGTDFYRIRSTDNRNLYELFDYKDMYMMSSSLSAKVSTARFNLSGYACLYLAESLYLAWEECRRPDFHTANFVRFSNTQKLKVFNLTMPESSKLNSLAALFRAYLSLVCSAKAKDEDKDHWQYRVSNLFIKMIYMNNRNLDGIKYMSSKRFEDKNFRMEYVKECAAYVFPPKNLDDKYCKKLAALFEMTASHSYFYFKIYGINFISPSKAATRVYDNTVFAFLEEQLKKEKTTPCKDII